METLQRKILLSRVVLSSVAHLRALRLLKIIKLLPHSVVRSLLIYIFDPNIIRRNSNYIFREKLILFKSKNGAKFTVNINDHLGYRFFMEDQFDESTLEIAEILGLCESDVLLDIGANVGAISIPVALKFGIEVIAVEASPLNCSILLKNIAHNKVKFRIYNNCVVSQELSRQNDYLKLFTKNGNSAANSIYENWNRSKASDSEFEYSKSATLDSLLLDGDISRIKLIKIDVEGSELEVIKGFSKIFTIAAPIVFEYRVDVMMRDLNDDGSRFVEELSKNYQLFSIGRNCRNILEISKFDPKKPAAAALGLPLSSLDEYVIKFQQNISE